MGRRWRTEVLEGRARNRLKTELKTRSAAAECWPASGRCAELNPRGSNVMFPSSGWRDERGDERGETMKKWNERTCRAECYTKRSSNDETEENHTSEPVSDKQWTDKPSIYTTHLQKNTSRKEENTASHFMTCLPYNAILLVIRSIEMNQI